MMKPHRLFDCLTELLCNSADDPLLVGKENGQWREYTVREVAEIVEKLATGLLSLGVGGKDMNVESRPKVALIAKNRPEWMLLDLAVQKAGAVLVPIYPTVHVNDLKFVLQDAAVKLIFVNDEELLEKVRSVQNDVPGLMGVYSFEHLNSCNHWTEILELGRAEDYVQLKEIDRTIDSEDLFTIIYTSGTTGTPKGVMLSHHNVLSNVLSCLPYLPVQKGTKVLSFLPLNHIFERMVTYVYLFAGVTIYYAESLDTLGDNLKEVKPRMFTTVPRLLEKVYEKILAKAAELSPLKKKLFFWAVSLGEKYDVQQKGSPYYRAQLAIANALVFKKWREGLGGALECIVTGAAACPVKLIRLFSAARITILEGYGQTESSPVICVNRMEPENRMFGTVGPVIGGVEVRIAADGEILCKGPNIMMGYYKREDLTIETVKEGWLFTGDIGVLVDNKFLKITDRKKEIFKTSGGKYVAPQPIENKLAESPFISQVMIIGSGEKFTAALIVPNMPAIEVWCKQKSIDCSDKEELLKNQRVHDHFRKIIDEMNTNFSNVEQVKKFHLLPKEWSIDGGELTPTLKLKRKVIMEKCEKQIEQIYRG
jgi:long-chain acyl-CoA synthetase